MAAGRVANLAQGIDLASLTIDAGLTTELLGRLRAERRTADASRAATQGAPA